MLSPDKKTFEKACRESIRSLAYPKCKKCMGSGIKGRLTRADGSKHLLRCSCTHNGKR